jgi:hypothetical protein
LADFIVDYVNGRELVILYDAFDGNESFTDLPGEEGVMPVRMVNAAELAASAVWIENWKRILPCITATRNLVTSSLVQAIERFVVRPQRLLDIESEFSTGDPILVRAAVFNALHAGRVRAPDLRVHELSLLTEFSSGGRLP